MCCSEIFERGDEQYVVGECPECGARIDKDGKALEGCSYSPVSCELCGYQGCDGSC